MSNTHLFSKAGFPRAPLANGLGRYVCQLQRITLKFCKSTGASRGMREFIENDLIYFAKSYPGIVVYVKPRRHRTPVLSAEYLNGEKKWVSCRNFTRDEVSKWINLMRTQSGIPEVRLRKNWYTQNPSVQGPWTPFVNKDARKNIAQFPNEDFSKPINFPPSATEELIELFKKQQLEVSN